MTASACGRGQQTCSARLTGPGCHLPVQRLLTSLRAPWKSSAAPARSLPQEGEIYELYLRPEYQGIGLGSRLFSEARRLLGSLGCKGLVVWTLEENDRAVNFYSALGGIDIAEGSETFDKHPLKKIAFVWP